MRFRAIDAFALSFGFVLIGTSIVSPHITHADTSATQSQIDQIQQQNSQLQQEIDQYQKQLTAVTGQKQTLQTAIKSIDLTRQKTSTQINVTQNQIQSSNLQINQLGTQIYTKQQAIDLDKQTLAQSLRDLDTAESSSLIEQLLSSDTLADSWVAIDNTAALNGALRENVNELSDVKTQLATQENQVSQTKDQLTSLNKNLTQQQGQLDATKKAKDTLLAQTKSQESTYQSLIATKKAQQKQFESQLASLEASLKNVTAAEVPHVGKGILNWPFSASFAQSCLGKAGALGNNFCITQFFGNTPFASANPQVYNGAGHNAIDIGMPIGTPVLAALSGTILGTGNTDLAHDKAGNQCYSFGKWVMVQHANGLDTLYAHLSQITVTAGQAVSTGDAVGYSGMTGYATGPHLHFGVYASAGVKILTLGQYRGATTPCANATMPVAPVDAYLNPMSYL